MNDSFGKGCFSFLFFSLVCSVNVVGSYCGVCLDEMLLIVCLPLSRHPFLNVFLFLTSVLVKKKKKKNQSVFLFSFFCTFNLFSCVSECTATLLQVGSLITVTALVAVRRCVSR